MIRKTYWSSCEVPLCWFNFNKFGDFSTVFWKNIQISNFMEIRLVGAELFLADDGRTDMTKLIFTFSQFFERAQQNKNE